MLSLSIMMVVEISIILMELSKIQSHIDSWCDLYLDTSDSTVSSHPFRFSATSNGSHGGGSEYTNGVAAITGTATTITVPHDAPNTLYYYCTSHSGMGLISQVSPEMRS